MILFFRLTLRRRFLLLPFSGSLFFFGGGGELELLVVVEELSDRRGLGDVVLFLFRALDRGVQSR